MKTDDLRAWWRDRNAVDLGIAWLFASMLSVPLSGETTLAALAALALGWLAWTAAGRAGQITPWRELGLMALAIGSITIAKAVSVLWSISPHDTLRNVGTHLHFVFWLPLVVLFRRAERPVDSMLWGVRLAALALFIWTLWFWLRNGIQLNPHFRLKAGAQNEGVLGQLTAVMVLWLAWVWRCRPTFGNLTWVLMGICAVVAAGGRTHITVMVAGLALIAIVVWRDRPSVAGRLRVLGVSSVLVVAMALALSSRMEQAWQEAWSYVSAPELAVTSSVGNRVGIYDAAWRALPDSPWLGFGAGTTRAVVARYSPVDAAPFASTSHYHQQVLQVVMETGILGLALCIVALWYASHWIRQRSGADPRIWPLYAILVLTTMGVGMFTGSLQQGLIHVFIVSVLAVLGAQCLKPPNPPRGGA